MTPSRCKDHDHIEYAMGGYVCAKCKLLSVLAHIQYRINRFFGWDKL